MSTEIEDSDEQTTGKSPDSDEQTTAEIEEQKPQKSELENGNDEPVAETSPVAEPSDSNSNLEINNEIGSNGIEDIPAAIVEHSEIQRDEGSRTFTMRELLNELKEDDNGGGTNNGVNGGEFLTTADPISPYSQDDVHQQYIGQNNAAMDLINSVTGLDEEGRSRQRILTFAAKRENFTQWIASTKLVELEKRFDPKYATAIERNPEDYDALYNWALVLQESADNVGPDSSSPSKDALLEEACKKYDEATHLCPTLHDAFYNWAIAISDRAKMRGRTKEAEELWKQATNNYEKAVQLNWNSPQALNNWGLALQELSAIVPVREKQTIVRTAISKFRAAIQLQFDFHRAIYNLGTVLYGLAEDTLRTGKQVSSGKDVSPNELYSQAAIYIAAAHALKPNYSVYRSALRLVRSMLPLPYLKVGYLTAPPTGNPIAPHSDWKQSQFALNHEGLLQLNKGDQKPSSQNSSGMIAATVVDKPPIKVDVPDIVSVSSCADLTLPPGAGLCIDTIHGPIYLVADTWESLDGWIDAIRLVYTIFARGRSDVLAGVVVG